jgi:cation:H+ antiporter
MTLTILLLVLGFVILIKGADWLVNGSVSLAKHYKVSELVIGLTIVAFGTSAPELIVNIISSIKGLNDVTMGNIVGSNLFNLMLILGLSGIIYPLIVQVKTIRNEIPFSLLAAIVLLVLANYTFNERGILTLNRLDGAILLGFFIIFMVYIFVNLRSNKETVEAGYKILKPSISLFLILIGLVSLILGSRLVVDNAVKIAHLFGASEKLIGITIISAGTSLPELVTSVVAAFRKKSDIAIGNIIGSNIFNIFLILGISSLITPIKYNSSFNFDILLLIIATILLFAFMFSGKKHKLDRWESALFLIGYAGYITYLLI